MPISKDEVKHIADLARLELSEEEIEKFQKELSSILEYVSQLSKVDTEKVEPTFQTTGLKNVFREDKVEKERELSQEGALKNAPDKKEGYFKVKPVF